MKSLASYETNTSPLNSITKGKLYTVSFNDEEYKERLFALLSKNDVLNHHGSSSFEEFENSKIAIDVNIDKDTFEATMYLYDENNCDNYYACRFVEHFMLLLFPSINEWRDYEINDLLTRLIYFIFEASGDKIDDGPKLKRTDDVGSLFISVVSALLAKNAEND